MSELLEAMQGSLARLSTENEKLEDMDIVKNTTVQPDMKLDEEIETVQPGGHQNEEEQLIKSEMNTLSPLGLAVIKT